MSLFNKTQQIAVIGAGYAGLACAFRLARLLRSAPGNPASITLINTDPRQELTCELYRVLRTGQSEFYNFLPASRRLGIRFIEAHVSAIDPEKKVLSLRGETHQEFKYDQLVITTGFSAQVPPINGLEAKLDTGANEWKKVFLFRNNVQVQQLRLALKKLAWSPETRFPKDIFAVIVGAGATGLEVAGELAALRGSNARARIVIVDEKNELLEGFSPIAKKLLKKELARLRIETVLGSPVFTLNDRQELEIQNGQVIPWDLLVVCTGGKPSIKIMEKFGEASSSAGLRVKRNLQIEGFPDHFAAGDVAAPTLRHHSLGNKRTLPKTAQYAVQEGRFIAEYIFDLIIHGVPKAARRFEPTDLGYMVSLGPYFGFGRIGPEIQNSLGSFFSPFVVGPMVDQIKRGTKIKYLGELKWDSLKAEFPLRLLGP